MRRRDLLTAGAAATLVAGCAHANGGRRAEKDEDEDEGEVTPAEDLMREHGVLRRVMLVFDEAARRLDGGLAVPIDALAAGAGLIRKVVEDYHEKLEEEHLFPRFEEAHVLVELVAVLRAQHQAGREVTDAVLALAAGKLGDAERAKLAAALRAFDRMYAPHAAREDTVLFPALHRVVGGAAYRELGEQFEDIEKEKLGPGGFEQSVADVTKIEQAFGLDDLAAFTPQNVR